MTLGKPELSCRPFFVVKDAAAGACRILGTKINDFKQTERQYCKRYLNMTATHDAE